MRDQGKRWLLFLGILHDRRSLLGQEPKVVAHVFAGVQEQLPEYHASAFAGDGGARPRVRDAQPKRAGSLLPGDGHSPTTRIPPLNPFLHGFFEPDLPESCQEAAADLLGEHIKQSHAENSLQLRK
jgi:hypothetical protein